MNNTSFITRSSFVTIALVVIVVCGMYLISRPQKRFLAIPAGFAAREEQSGEEFVFVQPSGTNSADTMIFGAGTEVFAEQSIEKVLTGLVTFDPSGMHPKSLKEFKRIQDDSIPIYVIQTGRFEGVVSVSFFAVIDRIVYPVSASWYVGEKWMDAKYNPFDDEKYRSYESLVRNYVSLLEQGFSPEDILPKTSKGVE